MAVDSQSVVTGATTASDSSSGVSSTTPVQTSSPTSAATQNTVQGGQNAQSNQSNSYGDDWWKEHQEGIFRHPRFKELTEYKQKYSQVEPLAQFAEQIGGVEGIQSLYQYFGPVYSRLMELAQNDPNKAQQAWSQLLPSLQAILTGEQAQQGQMPQQPQQIDSDMDGLDPRVKMLQQELEQLKQRDQMRSQQEYQTHQRNNFNQYLSTFDGKVSELNIPKPIAQLLHDRVANSISKYMPRDPRTGKQVNALDVYSEQAFQKCWEKEIEPLYREITGSVLDRTKTLNESGGPVIPNTNTHGKGAPNMAPRIRDRSERVAGIKSWIDSRR